MFKRIKQEGFKDCGPSCLLNIIKYYKGYVDINDLKEMCKTDKSGTTAYHLIEASKKLGFESYGIRCNLNGLKKENVILPCIAHVIINNSYNHYVVIEKIDFKKKKLLINDPIGKHKYCSYEEFNKIFNNILIYLYPIKKIINTPNNSCIKFFQEIIKSSTNQLVQVVIISIFITIFSIISSFYMQYMIDNIMFSKQKIILIFIIFMIIYILKIISDFFRNKILILINQKVDFNLTFNTFKQIISLPYRYYKNNTTGEIISKINDLEAVREVISKVALSLFIDLPLTILSLIIMYMLSDTLFFISLIIMLLYLFIIVIFRNKFNDLIDDATLNKASVTSYMVESINGYETIKGCNIENKIIHNFEDKYATYSNKIKELDNCYNYQYLLKELINNIGFIVIILIGIFLVMDKTITLGSLLSFNSLLIYFLSPIRNIIDLDNNLRQAKISIKKILYLYYKKNNYQINSIVGDVEFKDLSYSFDDVNNVLSNINLKIKNKSKVMVLGSSGSGKSTLFKILKQNYEIKRDKVYINGIDINDYKLNNIVYVSQNEILFSDTIENNIGNDIYKVSKICLIDEIIKKTQLGYKTLIEENGFNLSGGEKQRIILSRALANPFDILIIDEGLSQVDTNMERIIIKNILKEYQDKTIIFISHRLDNIDLFNQVIKIEKGKIIDDLSKNI